jgi:hypothetical protein
MSFSEGSFIDEDSLSEIIPVNSSFELSSANIISV